MVINNKNLMNLRRIILDHYFNPMKKGFLKKKDMLYFNQKSNYCIDNINLEVKIKNDRITHIRFEGDGCAIAISSIDMIANKLENMKISVVRDVIHNFINMVCGKHYNEKKLNELIIFVNVSKQPNRRKCALIGAKGILNLINDYLNKK